MKVVVDLDGTVADLRHRSLGRKFPAQEPDLVEIDPPFPAICTVVACLIMAGHDVRFFSGRHEYLRAATTSFLVKNIPGSGNLPLYMRKNGDYRPDHIIKLELLKNVAPWWPDLAIDDRPQVVSLWVRLGITTLAHVNMWAKDYNVG